MGIRKDDIEKYLRGELSPADMHALEKEALDDPFLAEALEGVEQTGADNFLHDLHRLNRRIHERTRHRKDKSIRFWGWTAGMAAAVLLVAVSGFLVISLLRDHGTHQQAMKKEGAPMPQGDDSLAIGPDSPTSPSAEQQAMKPSPRSKEPASVSDKTRARSSQQTAGDTSEATRDLLAQHEVSDETPEQAGVSELPTEVAQEPITLAEIPDEETETRKEKEVTGQTPSINRDSRSASGQSQTDQAVAQRRSAEVVLVKGKVTSATDGEGLPGVSVMLKGTNAGTVTDAEGNYQLAVPPTANKLVFAFIGFDAQEVMVENKGELNVALQENVSALSEVVVTGYGVAHSGPENGAAFRPAQPRDGKNDFKDYLVRSLAYPQEALSEKVEGRVTVKFTVQPDGQLTDFEVVRGIGHGCEEELIRAIKAGPPWEPASRGGVPFPDKVKVRYKFELLP